MTYWLEITVAAMIGFCAGTVLMGALMKRAREAALEDRIVRMLQEQTLRDAEQYKAPPSPPPPFGG